MFKKIKNTMIYFIFVFIIFYLGFAYVSETINMFHFKAQVKHNFTGIMLCLFIGILISNVLYEDELK